MCGFGPAPACGVWVSRVCAKELLVRCFRRANLEFGSAGFGLAQRGVCVCVFLPCCYVQVLASKPLSCAASSLGLRVRTEFGL